MSDYDEIYKRNLQMHLQTSQDMPLAETFETSEQLSFQT